MIAGHKYAMGEGVRYPHPEGNVRHLRVPTGYLVAVGIVAFVAGGMLALTVAPYAESFIRDLLS